MCIVDNLNEIRAKLPESVRLVAVSKTYPAEIVSVAYEAGQRIFGENRPQELVAKYESLPGDIQWHMIGTLQTNKVKYIAPFVQLIHSIDSAKLLETVHKEALKNTRVIDVLLQLHIADEQTKHGWDYQTLRAYLSGGEPFRLSGIRMVGVMGMATFTDDTDKIRKEFQNLRRMFEELRSTFFAGQPSFREISMGMSGDYEIAVQEGSTLVRIGSSIFGSR